jgi:hypothetical protein
LERYVLKSKARRRIATRAAVAGALGVGVILGVPTLSAAVGPVPVTYSCTPSGGTGTYNFQVTLTGPVATPEPSEPVAVTWIISQSTESPALTAVAPVPVASAIVVEGQLVASGPPITAAATAATVTPSASQFPVASLTAGAPLPIPTLFATVTPTAVGTFFVKPGAFTLRVGADTAGSGTSYTCVVAAASPANATPPVLAIRVASPSASPSTSPSTTPTSPSPSATVSSPRQTRTVFETVTQSPTRQVSRTPGGGAATGGGGDIGPDARMFLAVGSMLVIGAGVGGLMMRRRRPQRG